MKKIPEILMSCCKKIYKPHSIKFLDDCVKITFYCPICRNWVYLESKNGMKKMLSDIDLNKQSKQLPLQTKSLPFKYVKKGEKNGQK